MPTLAWKSGPADAPAGAPVTIMASRFELQTLRAVPSFFAASISAWRQALRADGCVGVSLKALPLARQFWTLSAWTSKEAIYAYSQSMPHANSAQRQTASMASSTFVFWDAPAGELPIAWSEATRRVEERLARTAAAR